MRINLARWDRAARGAAAAVGIVGALAMPAPASLVCGLMALYLGGTALRGQCLGYRLLGLSSCPKTRE